MLSTFFYPLSRRVILAPRRWLSPILHRFSYSVTLAKHHEFYAFHGEEYRFNLFGKRRIINFPTILLHCEHHLPSFMSTWFSILNSPCLPKCFLSLPKYGPFTCFRWLIKLNLKTKNMYFAVRFFPVVSHFDCSILCRVLLCVGHFASVRL